MTPAAFAAALDAIGWSAGQLADALGCHRSTPYGWLCGRRAVPEAIAAWLSQLAEAHRNVPPPAWP